MWKAKNIVGKWQLIYHTNNSLWRGWFIIPSLRVAYLGGGKKYLYTHSFWISFDWLFFSIGVHHKSQ
jgi:hypothetical protein